MWGNDSKRIDKLENRLNKFERELTEIHDKHREFRYRIVAQVEALEDAVKELEEALTPSAEDQIRQLVVDRLAIDKKLAELQKSVKLTPRDWEKLAFNTSSKSTTESNSTRRDRDDASDDATTATYMATMTALVSEDTPSRSSSSGDSSSSSSSYDSGSSYSSCDSSSSSCD